jgi:hypothetical protein
VLIRACENSENCDKNFFCEKFTTEIGFAECITKEGAELSESAGRGNHSSSVCAT